MAPVVTPAGALRTCTCACHHVSLCKLTLADVYFVRSQAILRDGERIRRHTIGTRRLQHRAQAA